MCMYSYAVICEYMKCFFVTSHEKINPPDFILTWIKSGRSKTSPSNYEAILADPGQALVKSRCP